MKTIILFSLLFSTVASAEGRKGLTWGVQPSNIAENLVNVSCHGAPATVGVGRSPSCDGYVGDTQCSERRPVLCINKSKSIPQPQGIGHDQYNQWASGEVRLTHDLEGYALNSLQAANSYCAEYFGPDWRMAEHHDGWGWGFWAVGKISNKSRFWVHIKNQPGNCWDGGEESGGSEQRTVDPKNSTPDEVLDLKPIEPKKSGLLQFM
jgi:hypothetical protein